MTKQKHLIPVYATLINNGIAHKAAENLLQTGYTLRHLRYQAKAVQPAPLPPERIAEYRMRYAATLQAVIEKDSTRALAVEYNRTESTISKIAHGKGGGETLSKEAREDIRRRAMVAKKATEAYSEHTQKRIGKELCLPWKTVKAIYEKVNGNEVSCATPEWSPALAFLTMSLCGQPVAAQGYY